ncbi:MAG: tRNA (adenosine(37)-N6)-dimethylallyltransferase MiaA [Candidatus Kapabacteria bacterium]|nr:tRNA (adenosine(37)-N6)-dimethylallyltransferase MiaA [Candidatus Kapabacteria bacterium]
MKRAIVIAGPTASGKTEVSLQLAKLLPVEIISADSRQIYKMMDIGTAKPSVVELNQARHHFIDILNPDQSYSAGKFAVDAKSISREIFQRGKIPLIVGGSGLYIKALCEGFSESPVISENKLLAERQKLSEELSSRGIEAIYDELFQVDPVSSKKYSDKNPRRILRALEYYRASGLIFSESFDSPLQKPDFETIYFGILMDRNTLYDRINLRTENMWNSGLIAETQRLLDLGYSSENNSLNTVGYKECIEFIKSDIAETDAIEKIKKNTRHYAKRQLTWFNRQLTMNWLQGTSSVIAKKIANFAGLELIN